MDHFDDGLAAISVLVVFGLITVGIIICDAIGCGA